ncbi:MAG: hypothetical protein R6U57_01045 [Anaerolineales bacterium]
MNRVLRITLIVAAGLVGAAALLWTGFFFGRNTWGMWDFRHGEMMSRYIPMGARSDRAWDGFHMGVGVMDRAYMDGWGGGRVPRGGRSMMDEYSGEGSADPLSVEEAHEAVDSYLDFYNGEDLTVEEIMVFDNHAYAIVTEKSTGIGAFELLVDPVTKEVFPEYGPNMMWNLKYSMMSGSGGYGMMGSGMMGGDMYGADPEEFEGSGELSVSPEEALQAAQRYLDEYAPGTEVSDEITPFYGYYTIDVEWDGEITGMVSVNGYTSQVFPHTWHGAFIEMSEG